MSPHGGGDLLIQLRRIGLRKLADNVRHIRRMESSRRWLKFVTGEYPETQSIISLPKDIFDGILFHSEVLLFNFPKKPPLKGHYFFSRPSPQKPEPAR